MFAEVCFRYFENLLEIPEGMHGELAFWVGLQIDDMTEQLYSVKRNLSFRHAEQPNTFCTLQIQNGENVSCLVDTNCLKLNANIFQRFSAMNHANFDKCIN